MNLNETEGPTSRVKMMTDHETPANPCDSNNNADGCEAERSSLGGQAQACDSEDWYILDAEDQNHQVGRKAASKSFHVETKPSPAKYIELDPLGPSHNHSPALVYLCAAIYSLVPLASLISALSLIALLFSRFYFVSLAYLLYVILDKNTCNRGKF